MSMLIAALCAMLPPPHRAAPFSGVGGLATAFAPTSREPSRNNNNNNVVWPLGKNGRLQWSRWNGDRASAIPRRSRLSLVRSAIRANQPEDIYILVHGLGGQPEDLSYLKQCLEKRDPAAIVHLARCNSGAFKTFDGVREGGSRLATEIRLIVKRNPSLKRISMVGNSLGGIYCRYAMMMLYDSRSSTIAGLKPYKFLTTATPHLGVGVHGYLSLVPESLQRIASRGLLGQTICELLLFDSDCGTYKRQEEEKEKEKELNTEEQILMQTKESLKGDSFTSVNSRPLLAAMAGVHCQHCSDNYSYLPRGWRGRIRRRGTRRSDNSVDDESNKMRLRDKDNAANDFTEALKAFTARCAYANAENDFLVPYESAHPGGPLRRVMYVTKPAESGVVLRRTTSSKDVYSTLAAESATQGINDGIWPSEELSHKKRRALMDEMSRSLTAIGWEEVTVVFPGALPLAHNKICALERDMLSSWLNSEGRPVVEDQAKWLVPHAKLQAKR